MVRSQELAPLAKISEQCCGKVLKVFANATNDGGPGMANDRRVGVGSAHVQHCETAVWKRRRLPSSQ